MKNKLYVILDPSDAARYSASTEVLVVIATVDEIVTDRGRIKEIERFNVDLKCRIHYPAEPGTPTVERDEVRQWEYCYITIETERHGTIPLKGTDFAFVPQSHAAIRRKIFDQCPYNTNLGSWLFDHHFGLKARHGFMLFGIELEE